MDNKKTKRTISIVLPDESNKFENSRRKNSVSDVTDGEIKYRDYSVTSYYVQHCKRINRGNYILHVWNDVASMLTHKDKARLTASPCDRRIGHYEKELLEELLQPVLFERKNKNISIEANQDETYADVKNDFEDGKSISSTITPIPSETYSISKENSRKKGVQIPIVSFCRPRVAQNNETLRYSDVPLLREQMKKLFAQQKKQKYREDFARASYDINRLKLNRPQTAKGNFHNTCKIYMSTTEGGSSAINSQLS